MSLPSLRSAARERARSLALSLDDAVARLGWRHSEDRLEGDAEAYWRGPKTDTWKSNSHWRSGGSFDEQRWRDVGERHLELWAMFAQAAGADVRAARIIEWGVGGGANAVRFAPLAEEFVGVDVAADSLDEAARVVAEACDTRFVPVLVDVASPESVLDQVSGGFDLFLCVYVMELLPSAEYGLELMRIAKRLLNDDGLAVVQIKYRTEAKGTRSKLRHYRWNVADMTSYGIDEFWIAAGECGLTPLLVHIVPKNELDERYAYFLLAASAGSTAG